MGKYTAIADIDNALVTLLRNNLVPETVANPALIDLCLPFDKGDVALGLYLYDVKESEGIRLTEKINVDSSVQMYPPIMLTLYYMLTAYSTSDIKFRAADDHRLLGRAMQTFYDNAVIKLADFGIQNRSVITDVRVEMLNMELEDKMKIWAFPNMPYRLSVCYKVGPVEIESLRTRTVRRVVDMQMRFEDSEPRENAE